MTPERTRIEAIADFVTQRGEVRIDELAAHFGVSRMTIHRDIDRLAQQGVLRKLHGSVSAQPSGIYESHFRYRSGVASREKQALAEAALSHIQPGQVIMLDDSTTASAVAPLLGACAPLTVVTNSVTASNVLREMDEIDLISVGGQYHRTYNAYIGHLCLNALRGLRTDLLICSASAVQGLSAFIQDQQVVAVKQAMMAAAARKILLLDHSKFGKTALHLLEDLTAFDAVLVTDGLPPAEAVWLEKAGVPLMLVRTTRT
ncbi:DeoR/GlpR family DNA-binding transcription regulator [Gellertiella hungarica]|uniref:DeoR/GlpR family transcriptional regulator of sugar metabolism n=1 Tax=Gellertiella hungarica TaxID=1572859 RepID=A0A7W6NM65_9HYPH|nr:DeoR/GlpR family DNA-binding transcription regulator [Gellertiella hungarica]MBB4066309.1 DeoR/GlpR family transcriptional regulator of sugar metabolism [Gellertiella hungarica]